MKHATVTLSYDNDKRSRTVNVSAPNYHGLAQRIADHMRDYAARYGVSPFAVNRAIRLHEPA